MNPINTDNKTQNYKIPSADVNRKNYIISYEQS